jgi:hypothetical protein
VEKRRVGVRASKAVGCGKVDKACCGGFRRGDTGVGYYLLAVR